MSETNAMRRAAEIALGCTSVAEAAKQIRREALRIDSLNENRADQALLSRAATTQAGDIMDSLEQAVRLLSQDVSPSDCSLFSIAVSMKRIADALNEPNEYGEVGGAAIAGSIKRGLQQ